jgi:hypothetical protein
MRLNKYERETAKSAPEIPGCMDDENGTDAQDSDLAAVNE